MSDLASMMSIVKLLRGDPLLGNVQRIQSDVARLIRGYLLDGLSALEDAANTSDRKRQRKLIKTAREYFRQAASREAGSSSTRASEYVALCYELLGHSDDATRWLRSTYARVKELHARAFHHFYGEYSPTRFVYSFVRSGITEEQRIYGQAQRRGEQIIAIADMPLHVSDNQQLYQVFLLEQQARRLQANLRARGIAVEPLMYMFAEDDMELVRVRSGNVWHNATRTLYGQVRLWSTPVALHSHIKGLYGKVRLANPPARRGLFL